MARQCGKRLGRSAVDGLRRRQRPLGALTGGVGPGVGGREYTRIPGLASTSSVTHHCTTHGQEDGDGVSVTLFSDSIIR